MNLLARLEHYAEPQTEIANVKTEFASKIYYFLEHRS